MSEKEMDTRLSRLKTEYPLYFDQGPLSTFVIGDVNYNELINWVHSCWLYLIHLGQIHWSPKLGTEPELWESIKKDYDHRLFDVIQRHENFMDAGIIQRMTMASFLISVERITGVLYTTIDKKTLIEFAPEAYNEDQLDTMVMDMHHYPKPTRFDLLEDGSLLLPTGIYRGPHLDGVPHGHGILTDRNDNTINGEWEHGILRNGKIVYQPTDRFAISLGIVSYEGTFNSNNQPFGKGSTLYTNGNRYEGQWNMNASYDPRNGKGVLYYADGRVMEGVWNNGEGVGVMKNMPMEGEVTFDDIFVPYVSKTLQFGIVLDRSVQHPGKELFYSYLFDDEYKDQISEIEWEGTISSWWENNRTRMGLELCRDTIEIYSTQIMIDNRCDMVLYVYDEKNIIRGLSTIVLHPEEECFMKILSFCAQSHTRQIGSSMMLFLQSLLGLILTKEDIQTVSICLDSLPNPATMAFYRKMGFVEDIETHPDKDLVPMIWTLDSMEKSEELRRYFHLLALSSKRNFSRQCEGKKSKKTKSKKKKLKKKKSIKKRN